jgi:hypothetical protein
VIAAALVACVSATTEPQAAPPAANAPPATRAVVWIGTREVAAPAAWSDHDPATFAELDPEESGGEARFGLVFEPPRPCTGLDVDFLSLYAHVFEGVPSSATLEMLVGEETRWRPVVAKLERDESARGDLAKFQQFGGVRWRATVPRCLARGVRLVLRRAADERAAFRRFVVRELAPLDDASAPVAALEQDAVARALGPTLAPPRPAKDDALDEAQLDWSRPEHGATRRHDGEGAVVEWLRPHLVGQVDLDLADAQPVEWWDGVRWQSADVVDVVTSDERSRRPRTTLRFVPVATTAIRVVGAEEGVAIEVRLGADGVERLARRETTATDDALLSSVMDTEADAAQLSGFVLPCSTNAAVIGRPDDPVETLVAWNGTLHQTEHGEESGPLRWSDRFCAFVLDGELLGEEPDALTRRLFDHGRPGVVTTTTRRGVRLEVESYTTAPGDVAWADVVTLRLENESPEPRHATVAAILGRRRHPRAARGELELAPLPTGHRFERGVVRDEEKSIVAWTPDATRFTQSKFESQLDFDADLAPAQAVRFRLVLPSVNGPLADAAKLAEFDFERSRARFDDFWNATLPCGGLDLPEHRFGELVPALLAQIHVVLFDEVAAKEPDGTVGAPRLELRHGAYADEEYRGVDEASAVVALAQFGHFDAAQRAVERMVAPDLLDGGVGAGGDSRLALRLGVAACAAVDVAALSHDRAFVERVAPRLDAIGEQLAALLHTEDESGGPLEGLLPKSTYGGDPGAPPARDLAEDGVAWRALHELAWLANLRGVAPRAAVLAREASQLRRRLLDVALAASDVGSDPPFVPMALELGESDLDTAQRFEHPYDFLAVDELGNRWSRAAPRLQWSGALPKDGDLAEWVEKTRAQRGGTVLSLPRFHSALDATAGLGMSGYGDDARVTRCAAYAFLAHGLDPDVFTGGDVHGLFPLRTSNAALRSRLLETRWHWGLWSNDAASDEYGSAVGSEPVVSAAGVGLQAVRRLLLEELPSRLDWEPASDGPRALHLLRNGSPRWLDEGRELHFTKLPTEFGLASLDLETHDDGHVTGAFELTPPSADHSNPLSTPLSTPVTQVVLWLHRTDSSNVAHVWIDQQPSADFSEQWLLLPSSGRHEFRVEF